VTSRKEVASSTSKEGIIVELKTVSKSLEDTTKTSTERKISVEGLMMALSRKMKTLLKAIRMWLAMMM
jgi:hypothetical protein